MSSAARRAAAVFAALALSSAAADAPAGPAPSPTADQRRARGHLREGDRLLREEAFRAAIDEYGIAARLDPLLFTAPYGMGRARMALRDYDGAVFAYLAARVAFVKLQSSGGDARQVAARARDDQIRALVDAIRETDGELRMVSPASRAGRRLTQRLYELDAQFDVLQELKAAEGASGPARVPAALQLALGSAYFRAGRLADAEREYKAALEVKPDLGEARNNLAVVYFETGRPAEAQREIARAEGAGFKVHPELKRAVSNALN